MKNEKAQIAFGALALTLAGAVVLNVAVNAVSGVAGALSPKAPATATQVTVTKAAPATPDTAAERLTALEREAGEAYERVNNPAANCSAVFKTCW